MQKCAGSDAEPAGAGTVVYCDLWFICRIDDLCCNDRALCRRRWCCSLKKFNTSIWSEKADVPQLNRK